MEKWFHQCSGFTAFFLFYSRNILQGSVKWHNNTIWSRSGQMMSGRQKSEPSVLQLGGDSGPRTVCAASKKISCYKTFWMEQNYTKLVKCYTTGNNWGQISCVEWNPLLLDLGECAAGSHWAASCWTPCTSDRPNTCSVWQTHSLKNPLGAQRHFINIIVGLKKKGKC